MPFCTKCGKELSSDAAICINCGKLAGKAENLNEKTNREKMKEQVEYVADIAASGIVVGANTWSESHIYGGGYSSGHVDSYGNVSVNSSPINNTIIEKNRFFIKQADNSEVSIEIHGNKFPVRDGHKVTVIYGHHINSASGYRFYFYNHTTGKEFVDYTSLQTILGYVRVNVKQNWNTALLVSIIISGIFGLLMVMGKSLEFAKILGWILLFVLFCVFMGKGILEDNRISRTRKKMIDSYTKKLITDAVAIAKQLDRVCEAPTYINKGNTLFSQGLYDMAIVEFNKAISMDHTNQDAHFGLYRCFDALKKDKDMIRVATKLIDLEPRIDSYYFLRSIAYYSLQRYEEALADLQKAIEMGTDDYNIFNLMGRCYWALEKRDMAIDSYSKSIMLGNNKAENYYDRGASYYWTNMPKLALDDLNKAISLDSSRGEYYSIRGKAKYDLSIFKDSIEDFSQAIKLNDDNNENYYHRGLAHYQLGEHDKAINDFTIMINTYSDKDEKDAYYLRAASYLAKKDYAKALEDINNSLSSNDSNVSYQLRSLIYSAMGKYDLAITDYKHAIGLNPNDADCFMLAKLYDKANMSAEAVAMFSKFLLGIKEGDNENVEEIQYAQERLSQVN